MTLDEAIEIQKAYIDEAAYEGTDEFMAALKLGIEAIKRERRRRTLVSYHSDDIFIQLRGETKE